MPQLKAHQARQDSPTLLNELKRETDQYIRANQIESDAWDRAYLHAATTLLTRADCDQQVAAVLAKKGDEARAFLTLIAAELLRTDQQHLLQPLAPCFSHQAASYGPETLWCLYDAEAVQKWDDRVSQLVSVLDFGFKNKRIFTQNTLTHFARMRLAEVTASQAGFGDLQAMRDDVQAACQGNGTLVPLSADAASVLH